MITKFKIFESSKVKWYKKGKFEKPIDLEEDDDIEYVTDYKGNIIKKEDAIWCPYDKEWCLKKNAIWLEIVGFYVIPPPNMNENYHELDLYGEDNWGDDREFTIDSLKPGITIFVKDEPGVRGIILKIEGCEITFRDRFDRTEIWKAEIDRVLKGLNNGDLEIKK